MICLECHGGKSRCRIAILFAQPDNKPESDLTTGWDGERGGGEKERADTWQPDLTEMQKAILKTS